MNWWRTTHDRFLSRLALLDQLFYSSCPENNFGLTSYWMVQHVFRRQNASIANNSPVDIATSLRQHFLSLCPPQPFFTIIRFLTRALSLKLHSLSRSRSVESAHTRALTFHGVYRVKTQKLAHVLNSFVRESNETM